MLKVNKRPFNVFPSIGYMNSQYQIYSNIDGLQIDIIYNNANIKSIKSRSDHPIVLEKLDYPGKYTVQCEIDGNVYEQEINVRDALRLGSSMYKKAYLFDDSPFSFFLMKDRMLLFDENKKVLLTENNYSPTDIKQLDNSNFLFITKFGGLSGTTNLGIYNTDTFSIVSELISDYSLIELQPELNKVWLLKKTNKTIHCFRIISRTGYFEEILKFENFNNFNQYDIKFKKRIEYTNKVYFISFEKDKIVEIPKDDNIAIDYNGNYIEINKNIVKYNNIFDELSIEAQISEELFLNASHYFFIGQNVSNSSFFKNLSEECNKIKKDIEKDIPIDINGYDYYFEDSNIKTDIIVSHIFYQSHGRLLLEKKESVRNFLGITLSKNSNIWYSKEITSIINFKTLYYCCNNSCLNIFDNSENLEVIDSNPICLIVKKNDEVFLIKDSEKQTFKTNTIFDFFMVNDKPYLLAKHDVSYSLMVFEDEIKTIFEDVKIHNIEYLKKHKKIFYSIGEEILIYDLRKGFYCSFNIKLDKTPESFLDKYIFGENYALTSSNLLLNPKTLEIKDFYSRVIESCSFQLNKVLTINQNNLILSVYNIKLNSYEEYEIKLKEEDYAESYLSPNGEFLLLKDQSNQYLWFDIKKNEVIKFFNGKFLEFSKEGNLIVEEFIDRTRKVKIFDPKSFSDITPINYHYYKFKSSDGKLFAELDLKTKYINMLNGNELSRFDYLEYQIALGEGIFGKKKSDGEVEINRKNLFLEYNSRFRELKVFNYLNIKTDDFIEIERYIEIGIVETNTKVKILLPSDTEFYNYASFSHDNKFVGIVGKPNKDSRNKSLILLCSIYFSDSNKALMVNDTFISREPSMASWVCGFSNTGYFGTYDSGPNTFIINLNNCNYLEEENKMVNLNESKLKIWKKIWGKNFLCFSPSGNYMALSEQGYRAMSLGGSGHQESNSVYIADTNTGSILTSFAEHGDAVGSIRDKDLTFVAFSEDEKRLMSRSKDGVVIVRNINL
jgi:hypothetical protein